MLIAGTTNVLSSQLLEYGVRVNFPFETVQVSAGCHVGSLLEILDGIPSFAEACYNVLERRL